jgi:eukaryotic-like serine/threonine-protein kinase
MAVMHERVVADRYQLDRSIGRGGMGVVWLGHDRLLDREVAVKEITFPGTLPDQERDALRARVLREARTAARLNHPSAITIYDVLEEQGRAFIIMELITAPTLSDLVASEGTLPPERAARVGLQVAAVLAAAHRAGIVHRDVKPANVMVADDGGVWLADFGIAHVQGDPRLTTSGMIVGSPWYMAPEQAAGGDIGPAVDLWGLGATMYYAVEGRAPFERDSSLAALAAVASEPPPPLERAGSLEPLILSLLAKDPAARPGLRQVRIRLARVAGAAKAAGDRSARLAPAGDLFTPMPAGAVAEGQDMPAPVPVTERQGTQTLPAGPRPFRWRPGRPLATALPALGGMLVLAAVVAVVLALTLNWTLRGNQASGGGGPTPTRGAAAPTTRAPATTSPPTTAPKATNSPTTSPSKSGSGSGEDPAVPGGWTRFANPGGGYTVAYPSGWRRSTGLARHGTRFSEGTGRSIKVESASPPQTPPDGDPLPGWITNERYWSSRLPGYHRIGSVRRGSYHGMRAAIWEYTYTPNGHPTHALNVNFVSPSGTWGYSVLSLVPEDRWSASQPLLRSFEQSFSPLA